MKETEKGWICLHRKFLDWEWYDDANTMRVFIHCLLLANHKNKKWRGKIIKRGSFITSQPKLANALSLTIMQIRNSLRKLKTSGEITVKTTPDYSVIILNNYNFYQDDNRLANSQESEKEQTKNRQTTTTNNDNNIDTNSYINISLSHEITEDERELLKKYVKENKLAKSSVTAYVNKIIKNGDHIDILKEIKEKQAKKSEQKNSIEKDYQKVKNERTACIFALKHWGNNGENPLVQEILNKYNLQMYMTESQLHSYYHDKYNK